jgi:cell division protein FtsI/penicillin-binding protein 2
MPVIDDIQVYEKRRVLYSVLSVFFLILFARLVELQLIYKDVYGQQAEENSIRVIPKEPIRGYVYDRRGRLVVDNRASFTVTVMPFEFKRENLDSRCCFRFPRKNYRLSLVVAQATIASFPSK